MANVRAQAANIRTAMQAELLKKDPALLCNKAWWVNEARDQHIKSLVLSGWEPDVNLVW